MKMVVLALAVLYTTICAVFDARTFRVPNAMTLPALVMALVYRAGTAITTGESVLPALAGMLFLYAAWFNDFFRGADAKVMMALLLLFPDVVLCVTVCAAIVLFWLIRRAFSKATSKLPALVPTALGVWMYSVPAVLALFR
jgi:Flp pilus assembly protein protease CpaA